MSRSVRMSRRVRNRKLLAGGVCVALVAAAYSAEALTDGMQVPGPAVTDDVVALLGKRSPGVRIVGRLGKTKLAKGPAFVPRSLVASRGVSRPAPAPVPAAQQTAAAAAPAVPAAETPIVIDNPALVAALNPPDFVPVFAGGGIAIPPFVGGGGGGGGIGIPGGGGGGGGGVVVSPPPTGVVTPPTTTTPPPTGEVTPPPTVVTPPTTVITPPPGPVTPPPGPEVTPLPVPESAVPEPETWATMIIGFGAIGWAMRRRRRTPGHLQPIGAGDLA